MFDKLACRAVDKRKEGSLGLLWYLVPAREVGDSLFIISDSVGFALSHASRALFFITRRQPGVPLRSTPGFMLSPRSAG